MANSLEFGFLPQERSFSGGGFAIEPRPDIRELIQGLQVSNRVNDYWFYPPLHDLLKRHTADSPSVTAQAPTYGLRETHILRSLSGSLPDPKLCELAITVLGFIHGLRLIPEGWSHFYRAATRVGQLVDFHCPSSEIEGILNIIRAFWDANFGTEIPTRMFAALHWHLFSQSYEHEFELFNAQYIVMDTCWWIFDKLNGPFKGVSHAKRPVELCQHFQIPIPGWAVITGNSKSSYLSHLRNEFVHGGYFAAAPIGFEFPTDYPNVVLELQNLNSRLLLALLGVRSLYIESPVDTLQSMLLKIK